VLRLVKVDKMTNKLTSVAMAVIKDGERCTYTPSSSKICNGMIMTNTLESGNNTEMPAKLPHRFWIKRMKSLNSLKNAAPLFEVLMFSPHYYILFLPQYSRFAQLRDIQT